MNGRSSEAFPLEGKVAAAGRRMRVIKQNYFYLLLDRLLRIPSSVLASSDTFPSRGKAGKNRSFLVR